MAEKMILPDLSPSDEMFLSELSGTIDTLHERHVLNPKEFFPYDFDEPLVKTDEFSDAEMQLPDAVIASLYVNLITEDGLPYYTSALIKGLPRDDPFRGWLHRWTAEEGRHGPTIANYMKSTGQIDMHWVERGRMAMMIDPDTPQPGSFIEGVVYPAFQEPATEISHRNTMLLLPRSHKAGKKALALVTGDEVKHGDFYIDLTTKALEVDPSTTIIAIAKQVIGFAMPGKSIPEFDRLKKVIAGADIFGPKQLKKIYDDLITEKWQIWDKPGLTPEAEKARQELSVYLRKMGRAIDWAANKKATK